MKKRTAFIGVILSLIPFVHPLLIQTGVVLFSSGVMLTLIQRVNAESAKFYFDSAFEEGNNGDHYGAISHFSKVIEIEPNNFNAFYNRACNKGNLKDYYGEISDYNKAIEIDPMDKDSHLNRSIAEENIGDIKGAFLDAKKAVYLGNTASENQTWIKKNC